MKGFRTSLSATIGTTDDFLNTYTPDSQQRLTSLVQQVQSGGNPVAGKRPDFQYNLAGQFTSISPYDGTGTSNLRVNSFCAYDEAGRLLQLTHEGRDCSVNAMWQYDAMWHNDALGNRVEFHNGPYYSRSNTTGDIDRIESDGLFAYTGRFIDFMTGPQWHTERWYDYLISAGPLEGTNNKIKTMTRQHYGLRDGEFFLLNLDQPHETKYALVG